MTGSATSLELSTGSQTSGKRVAPPDDLRALGILAITAFHSGGVCLFERLVRRGTFFRSQKTDRILQRRSLGFLFMALAATVVVASTTIGSAGPIGAAVALASRSTPSPTGSGVTKLLIIGDSTALTLGFDLPAKGDGWNTSIDNQGVEGCGVAIGPRTLDDGNLGVPGTGCNSATPVREQWPAKLKGFVASDKPNIVALLAGRWEVVNRVYHGRWTNILNPTFRKYVKQQLKLAVKIGTASGAHMVLLTAPCYSSGDQPNGLPWPEDSASRLQDYNDLLYQVAAEYPKKASVVNLNGIVCPRGKFTPVIDGVTIRAPDGVHFPYFTFYTNQAASPDTGAQVNAFKRWIGPRIMPELVAGTTKPTAGSKKASAGTKKPST